MFRSSRFMNPVFALAAVSIALGTIGCAHLPYILETTRDTIVGVEIALQADATFEKNTGTIRPRITLVRGFVRGSEVDELAAIAGHVLATTRNEDLTFATAGYKTGVWNGIEGTAMTLEPSPALRRIQERMVEGYVLLRIDRELEEADDYIVTPDGAPMSEGMIHAIDNFVPDASGPRFQPHAFVSTAADAAKRPGATFGFRAAGVAVYQINSFGRAEKLLWSSTGR